LIACVAVLPVCAVRALAVPRQVLEGAAGSLRPEVPGGFERDLHSPSRRRRSSGMPVQRGSTSGGSISGLSSARSDTRVNRTIRTRGICLSSGCLPAGCSTRQNDAIAQADRRVLGHETRGRGRGAFNHERRHNHQSGTTEEARISRRVVAEKTDRDSTASSTAAVHRQLQTVG
jgi:hypothetical protein